MKFTRNILVVDDEELALLDSVSTLKPILHEDNILSFQSVQKALEYASNHSIDIAFLDIEMAEVNGIELAKQLKQMHPNIHIIFITRYDNYAVDAFAIHATGFLMKPILKEEVVRELTFLYGSDFSCAPRKIVVKTFGGFDIIVDGRILEFKRAKAKELLAYLIDRNGRGITAREACAILWEDGIYSKNQQSNYRNVVAEFIWTLTQANIQQILVKKRNYLAIRPELLECDSYQFIKGDASARNAYHGDYMCNYSWSKYSSWLFET